MIEVLQHGIIVHTLPKVLLSTSSCWSLKKKKSACLLLCTFKEDICELSQHFDVLWVGLLVSLFLLISLGVFTLFPLSHLLGAVSLTAFSWGEQWPRPCCSSARRGGMSAETGGTEETKITFVYVCVCVLLAGGGIPEFAQTFLWTLLSSKEFAKIPIWKSACVWKCFSVCLNLDEMA